MRVLVVHNQLWAHYKSKLFFEINKVFEECYPDSSFKVVHIADYEESRKAMYNAKAEHPYQYPYKVLFNASVESVAFKDRLFALLREFNEFKPTVLNITGYFDWAQILLMNYARLRGVKVVISTESSAADHNRSTLKETIKRFILSRANAFFCFGTSSAAYLKTLGVTDTQIAVKHAAVVDDDTILSVFGRAEQANSKRGNAFIYVGRLASEKNLEMLLAAFLQVNPVQNPWKLIFVGNGPSRDNLEKIAAHSPNVVFEGGCPWYQVPDHLAHSDVLILPSKSEPWGLVVNEAMVCGKAVIVSNKCGCAPDLVIENENGYTFDPNDQRDLEQKLLNFIQYPERIHSMGRKSLRIIQPFSAHEVAREMTEFYKKLTN